ncbi:MAG: serine hydrolase domain-containing protein, partial [Pseudomonadota bacterium]
MTRFLFFTLLLALMWERAWAGIPEAADYNAEKGGVSLVVIQNGEIIHESYPNGGGPDSAWALASGTKSFSGIIAAAAVQDGLLSLDERAVEALPEWIGDPNKSKITLRQILSLTSGIEP